ncbi:MAG: glycosyltransferase involved in cell wall biosynthesis [Paraglaciecola sp.]|jgi:glycosyltransferase involved in cell wall biosynthesis
MNKRALPLVSVVIPMFNVGQYIEECIESVLAQTFKNFEIICVDDGCTDDTLHKLARFSDPRIKLIQQTNRGLSGARNTGILASRAMYVGLLDADDIWAKEKLALHINHLNNRSDVGVSYCPSLFINENSKSIGIGQYPKLKNISAKDVLCRNPVGNGSAPVIRRRLFKEVTLVSEKTGRKCIFDEDLRQSEDIELWLRIALLGNWKFEGIPTPLTFYRVNDDGLSSIISKQYASWCLAIQKNQKNHSSFFKRYLPLARAYQLRYLARRAIRSGEAWQAIKLVHKALLTHPKIVIEEPARTLATYGCALLSLLPHNLYRMLENTVMRLLQNRSTQNYE